MFIIAEAQLLSRTFLLHLPVVPTIFLSKNRDLLKKRLLAVLIFKLQYSHFLLAQRFYREPRSLQLLCLLCFHPIASQFATCFPTLSGGENGQGRVNTQFFSKFLHSDL